MFITATQFAKPKSKFILVTCQSMLSRHKLNYVRERLGEKLEFMSFDPYVQANSVYKELKKLRSIKNWKGTNTIINGVNITKVDDEFRRMQ